MLLPDAVNNNNNNYYYYYYYYGTAGLRTELRLMPMVFIVWCVNELQENSPNTRPLTLMTSSPLARAFVAADIPVTKEPNGLSISDDKRPDCLTRLPWQEGKPLAWDVTVIILSFGCVIFLWPFSRCICWIGRHQKTWQVCQSAQLLNFLAHSIWKCGHS